MLLLRHEYAMTPIQSTTPRLHQHGKILLEFSVNQHGKMQDIIKKPPNA